MTATATPALTVEAAGALEALVRFLETGSASEEVFAPDAFADLTLPWWRVQAEGAEGVTALRTDSHPFPGTVIVRRVDPTPTGFVLEFEERWRDGGQDWYCREMLRADVDGGRISDLSVYCTGDWDEARQRKHSADVRLLRN